MFRFSFFLIIYLFSLSLNAANDFHKYIAENYKDFQILNLKDFAKDIKLKTNPALITGKFNNDSLSDFAALIHNKTKKRYDAGEYSYDYFDGKLIVCHGFSKKKYHCKELAQMPMILPYSSYLIRISPQKTGCYKEGSKDYLDVKTDAIGWYYPEKGASHYIYQSDSSYLNCVTSD